MAKHKLFCLVAVAILGTNFSHGQPQEHSLTKTQDVTPPNLMKEEEDNSRYKTLEANATLLKLLVDDKNGVSRSEVFDMLHSRDDREDHVDLPIFSQDTMVAREDAPIAPNSQAEFLQAGETVWKDSQRLRYSEVGGEPVGTAAGIMILVTCTIVGLAYTSLIVWRRIYLKRNGLKHELLRNEEVMAETRIEL